MNKRFDSAVEAARQTLDDEAQDEVAALIEQYVESRSVDLADLLTPEQIADLERRLASDEPNEDPELVRAIFRRHGLSPDF